jgi:hypothetical protein
VTQNFDVEQKNPNNEIGDTPLRKLNTIKEKSGRDVYNQ